MNDKKIFNIKDNITIFENLIIIIEIIRNPNISLKTNCTNFKGYLIFSISLLNRLMISLLFDNCKKENKGVNIILDKIFLVNFSFK